jgi:D-hydroxyproline dehydrogenase subunit beta
MPNSKFDLAIVGGGIIGLAHALAAARRGLRAVVIDRDAQANGASVRNFGLVVVSGQQAGECRKRAERTRALWEEVAREAGIAIVHRGMLVTAQRPQAMAVLEAFANGEMGDGCALLDTAEARRRWPFLSERVVGALWSPHELRMESRTAIPRLKAWLTEKHGVTFVHALVHGVENGRVMTNHGPIAAPRIVVAPGDDLHTLFSDRLAAHSVTRCKLQMLRVSDPAMEKLPCAVISDLSLLRYGGFADLPQAKALAARLRNEQPTHLQHGIHLIAVRSEDSSLVLGDSHHYGPAPDPFGSAEVDELILDEYRSVFGHAPEQVTERWIGTYASAPSRDVLIDRPDEATRLVVVTSGTGASTGLAIGEEVVAGLFG